MAQRLAMAQEYKFPDTDEEDLARDDRYSADQSPSEEEDSGAVSDPAPSSSDGLPDFLPAALPSGFVLAVSNFYGEIPRFLEEVEADDLCDGRHAGACASASCVSFASRTECLPHARGVACGNSRLRTSAWSPTSLVQLPGGDRAVVNDVAIVAGALVTEFMGEARWSHDIASTQPTHCVLDGALILDGSRVGTHASFLRHSCRPNVQFQQWFVPYSSHLDSRRPGPSMQVRTFELRIGVFALTDIPAGSELRADWRGLHLAPRRLRCVLGCKRCRGSPRDGVLAANASSVTRARRAHKTEVADAEKLDDLARAYQLERGSCQPAVSVEETVSILRERASFFHSLQADLSSDHDDYVSKLHNHFVKSPWHYDEHVKYGPVEQDLGNLCVVPTTIFGLTFCLPHAKASRSKHLAVRKGIRFFRSVPACALVVPRQDTSAPEAASCNLEEVLAVLWSALREYRRECSAVGFDASGPAHERLVGSVLLQCQKAVPTPSILMQLLGAPGTCQPVDLNNAATMALHRRAKRMEVGTLSRLNSTYQSCLYMSNRHIGPFVVWLTKPRKYASLDDVFVQNPGMGLSDLVDRKVFEKDGTRELTVPALLKAIRYHIRTRSRIIWGSHIRAVLFPLQQISEAHALVSLLQSHLEKRMGTADVSAYRRQVLGQTMVRTPALHMDFSMHDPAAWSSQVIATQMNLTIAEYHVIVHDCRRILSEILREGTAWVELPPRDCDQMRTVVRAWIAHVDEFKQDLRESAHIMNHRFIGSQVEEYCMVPGGERGRKLRRFMGWLLPKGGLWQAAEAMACHSKGLSPLARADAGVGFRRKELIEVLVCELHTGVKTITSSSYNALASYPQTRAQPLHTDDRRRCTFVSGVPLFECEEGPFRATLVPSQALDYAAISECNDYAEGTLRRIAECNRPVLDLTPAELFESLVPAVGAHVTGGFLLSIGGKLHGGPGNYEPGASGRRVVCFSATGIEGEHYDGVHQEFWLTHIDSLHGRFCFWSLYHMVSFSLCYGVHAASHLVGPLPLAAQAMQELRLGPGYVTGSFYADVLAMARRLVEPDNLESLNSVLLGEPSRKRASAQTGDTRMVFGTTCYTQTKVDLVCIALWDALTDPQGVDHVLRSHFEYVGMDLLPSQWSGRKPLVRLRSIFRRMVAGGALDQADDDDQGIWYGVARIRAACAAAKATLPWSGPPGDPRHASIPPSSREEAKALAAAAAASERQERCEQAGFKVGSFISYERAGRTHYGVVSGFTRDGRIVAHLPTVAEDVVRDASSFELVREAS